MGHIMTLEESVLINPEAEELDLFTEGVQRIGVSSGNPHAPPPCEAGYM